MRTLFKQANRETEILENALTIDVLPEEDAATVASPSTLVVSGAEPSPRLDELRAAEAPLIKDGAKVHGPVGPSGTRSVFGADPGATHPELFIQVISPKGR